MPGKGKPFVNGDPRAGRPPGRANNATLQIRAMCRDLLNDPEYQASLKKRLIDGKLGNMEAELWHYAYGPPPTHQLDPLGELLDDLAANGGAPMV